jgi:hypothetical protein
VAAAPHHHENIMAKQQVVQTLLYGSMKLQIEMITPDRAAQLLAKNKSNRKLHEPTVEKYARAMSIGEWFKKPLAVCIMTDGSIGNGQHTLNAIIISGQPQPMLVAYNVPKETIEVMDIGRKRTVSDIAAFDDESVNPNQAAVARAIMNGGFYSRVNISEREILHVYRGFKDGINFAMEGLPGSRSAVVRAVIAIAYKTEDRMKLARFMDAVRTGQISNETENAAILLRTAIERAVKIRKGSEKQALYAKTQVALRAYLDDKKVRALPRVVTEYPFQVKFETQEDIV